MGIVRSLAAITALLGATHGVYAKPPVPTGLGGYQHASFSGMPNVPTQISGLAEDDEGYLWIVPQKGVTRFDGVFFKPFVPAQGEAFQQDQVTYVVAAQGGGVWLSSDTGGPTLVRDGHLTIFGEKDGYRGTGVRFYAGPKGAVRASSGRSVFEFANGHWNTAYEMTSAETIEAWSAMDTDGNLWSTRNDGSMVVRRNGEGPAVVAPGVHGKSSKVVTGPSGRVYVREGDWVHIYHREGVTLQELARPVHAEAAQEAYETREGDLWISAAGAVSYVAAADIAVAEHGHTTPVSSSFTRADGLSGDFPWPILEDREGNVWVGNENGLDVFRKGAFTPVPLPAGLHELSAASDRTGILWIASENYPVMRGRADGSSWTALGENVVTMAMTLDLGHNVAWAANGQKLWRLDAAGEVAIDLPVPMRYGPNCLATDSRGRLYVCSRTPFRWDGKAATPLPALPASPRTAAVDSKDVVWLGLAVPPFIIRLKGEVLDPVSPAEGLDVGVVKAFFPDGDGMWVGGTTGLQYHDGKRFHRVTSTVEAQLRGISGVVRDRRGYLWVQTLDGVLRSSLPVSTHFTQGGHRPLRFRRFGSADGLRGGPDIERTLPTLRVGGDGRLWAQTVTTLQWVDPEAIEREPAPPPPRIDEVISMQGSIRSPQEVILASDDRAIRVCYASPTLSRAADTVFSYRLRGLDDHWVDAGKNRDAAFTNLPPGNFVLELKAVNDEGIESPVTRLRIRRSPAWYETWQFRLFLLVPFGGLIWLLAVLRTGVVERRLRIRADEREAVARDLHDALLQRFQGVMLMLQTWSTDKDIPKALREEMRTFAVETHDVIIEGRGRILALRSGMDQGVGLYDELQREGTRLASLHGMAFDVRARGEPRALRPEARLELRDVLFEAMRNAFLHAGGHQVDVEIDYEADHLWLRVADDGSGIDEASMARAPLAGHFGMVGMRERLARLGGTMRVDSAHGEGTEVHVRVPARAVYST